MNYLNTMGNLLSFGHTFSLKTEKDVKRLQLYCIINVLVLGVIYGCSAALFSRILLGDSGFSADSANMAKVIIAGIPVAFFMHAGAALFIWVFLKAMGGKADFMSAYFHIGAAGISLWPLAPFAALLQAGLSSPPPHAYGRPALYLCLCRECKDHPDRICPVRPAHDPGHGSNCNVYQLFFISLDVRDLTLFLTV